MEGRPAWVWPSLKVIGPSVHWMMVPVPQPLESSTTPWNENASPSFTSLREGRTCRTAGSPGELQSTRGPGGCVGVGAGAATGVGAGVGVGAAVAAGATTRERPPERFTSAMQWASLMVNSYRPVSAIEMVSPEAKNAVFIVAWRGSDAGVWQRVRHEDASDECTLRARVGRGSRHWSVRRGRRPEMTSSPPLPVIVTRPPGTAMPETGAGPHAELHSWTV